MKKINVVRDNRDFNKIITKSPFIKDKNLVIYYSPNNLDIHRIGISVGTKIGKAHTRNNLKRKIRSISDKYKNLYSKGIDYIIIVRKNCLDIEYTEISDSFEKLILKIEKERHNEV